MAELDRERVAGLFRKGDEACTPDEKGKVLEDLITYLFELIPGMTVTARNVLDASRAQEIDVAFWNDGHPDGLRFFDPMLLVECKNWSAPVGAPELTLFTEKLRRRGRPHGIFVASNGVTGDPKLLNSAHHQLSSALEQGMEIMVLTRAEIEALEDVNQLVVLLKRKRAQLTVSGSSLAPFT